MKTNKLKIIVFFLVVIFAGYLREIYFVRLKWHELVATNNAIPPAKLWVFSFMENANIQQIQFYKISGTVVAVFLFWILTLWMSKLFFPTEKNRNFIKLLFLILFLSSGLLYLIGLTTDNHQFYLISRYVAGIIETPLCIMLVYPILKLKSIKT